MRIIQVARTVSKQDIQYVYLCYQSLLQRQAVRVLELTEAALELTEADLEVAACITPNKKKLHQGFLKIQCIFLGIDSFQNTQQDPIK